MRSLASLRDDVLGLGNWRFLPAGRQAGELLLSESKLTVGFARRNNLTSISGVNFDERSPLIIFTGHDKLGEIFALPHSNRVIPTRSEGPHVNPVRNLSREQGSYTLK